MMVNDANRRENTDAGFSGSGGYREHSNYLRRVLLLSGKYRMAVLGLYVAAGIGLVLFSVIPYTPVFPLLVLAGALVSAAAGVRGRQFAFALNGDARWAGGFIYTAFLGGLVGLMFSLGGTVSTALGDSGGIAPGGDRMVLLNISWPTVVISLAAMAIGAIAWRRIIWQAAGSLDSPRQAPPS
jgi:hypothetical protein